MKLQTSLSITFALLAAIVLAVAYVGYREVRQLGEALYEVGTVRLPSIEGLEVINEAKTDLMGSLRVLLAVNEPGAEPELERQRQAWGRAEAGWKRYEPLPQTREEAEVWRRFVIAWRGCREEHD